LASWRWYYALTMPSRVAAGLIARAPPVDKDGSMKWNTR
jgi:hypothetical protein